jgi:hypothetical protein
MVTSVEEVHREPEEIIEDFAPSESAVWRQEIRRFLESAQTTIPPGPPWEELRARLAEDPDGHGAALRAFYGRVLEAWRLEAEARDQKRTLAWETDRTLWPKPLWRDRQRMTSEAVVHAVEALEQAISDEHRRWEFLHIPVATYEVGRPGARVRHRFSITLGDIKRERFRPGHGRRRKVLADNPRIWLMGYFVEHVGLLPEVASDLAHDIFRRFIPPPSNEKRYPPEPDTLRRDWYRYLKTRDQPLP